MQLTELTGSQRLFGTLISSSGLGSIAPSRNSFFTVPARQIWILCKWNKGAQFALSTIEENSTYVV